MSKKKIKKNLKKSCPECSGRLVVVSESIYKGGVTYSEDFIECDECGYREKYKSSSRKSKDDFSDW